jgi:hypothetical protein
LAILVGNRLHKLFMRRGTQGGTGDEYGVQAKGNQDGNEQRAYECRKRQITEAMGIGFDLGHKSFPQIINAEKSDFPPRPYGGPNQLNLPGRDASGKLCGYPAGDNQGRGIR